VLIQFTIGVFELNIVSDSFEKQASLLVIEFVAICLKFSKAIPIKLYSNNQY
jgi:hypothetical protein